MIHSLYFDLSSGVAGDMLIAALLDSGLSINDLNVELQKLNIKEFSIKHFKTKRSSIEVSRFEVTDLEKNNRNHSHDDDHEKKHSNSAHHHKHNHTHDHDDHSHDHDHDHDHKHDYDHDHIHHHHAVESHAHRNLSAIDTIIKKSSLNQKIKDRSIMVFQKIAEVEAKAHGVSINEIHFHEVGAIDSIIDVVGFCIAMDLLSIDKIYFNKFRFGNGFVKCAHGKMPLPVPAVASLTQGFNSEQTDVPSELTTPTGAAILTVLGEQVEKAPESKIIAVGYGSGSREPKGIFGALRVLHLDETKKEIVSQVIKAEVNIDDMNGEEISLLCENLLNAFKQDVWFDTIQMKKGRPAVTIHVLLKDSEIDQLKQMLFKQSTAFGFRYQCYSKVAFDREIVSFQSTLGTCRIKIGKFDGQVKCSPEFEDCKSLSLKHDLALIDVMKQIKDEYLANS